MGASLLTCDVSECVAPRYCRGLCTKHYQRARKHGSATAPIRDKSPDGVGYVDRDGYRLHTIAGRRVTEHVLVAERALGKRLPRGAIVHHVNEDRLDNRPSNLVICTAGYHRVLHQRMNALAASGNPDYRKCNVCKAYDDPARMTNRGTSYRHRACHAAAEYRRKHQ